MKKIFIFIFLFSFINNIYLQNIFIEVESHKRWVTVNDIKKSLPRKKITVGYDIDDTLLFSSPGFYLGKKLYSDKGYYKFFSHPEFYEKMNNGWDKFSIPKKKCIESIEMHLKRGDKVIFITARHKTKTETVTDIIKELFIKKFPTYQPLVIFAGSKKDSKVEYMLKHKVKIFYGDSDSDIKQAYKANARPIRIIRARNSNHQPLPIIGSLDEEILVNSDY